uniref:TATA box binding protein associated factor (TAF) histone-like fold domain-containing protein n=1 Tax=Lotharella globosa TaxID=91324 RepID=A0A7S3ZD32_9EUKA
MASSSGDAGSAKLGPVPIQLVAEQLNIEGFDTDTADELATDVEYRLRQIISLASKFMKHSKRDVMTTEDIDCALRLLNVESLYGYSSSDPITFEKAEEYDDLFFVKDQVVSFSSILNDSLPKPPPEPTFSVHWLAVEGQQPSIPQNPAFEHPADESDGEVEDADAEVTGDAKAKDGDKQIVKQMVKHVLSKEQQMYYERVTDAMKGNDAAQRVMLKSLANDPGLHQLLPYFIQFIADEVVHNLRDLRLLFSLLRMAEALLSSNHLFIEPYLHQLLPSIMTCLVARRLCKKFYEDHWSLRDFAAELIAKICKQFGSTYPDLQPRIANQLIGAFNDATKPLTTHYGAIVGLAALGDRVVEKTLLRHLDNYLNLLNRVFNKRSSKDQRARELQQSVEARRCYGALLDAVGTLTRRRVYDYELGLLFKKFNQILAEKRSQSEPGKSKQGGKTEAKNGKSSSSTTSSSADAKHATNGSSAAAASEDSEQPSRKRRRTETGMESSSGGSMNGANTNGEAATEGGAGNRRRGLTWARLSDVFGEQILPYSKVGRFSDVETNASPSLEKLFL